MPRDRKRKTSRGQIDLSKYKDAYKEVKEGATLRKAADKYGVNHCSLLRYIRKREASGGNENQEMGYKSHTQVFNKEQERELTKYLIRCLDIYFGLPKKEVRKLAYELTVKYSLSRPQAWDDHKMAGEVWCRMFMERNSELSLRAAQATSLSKATKFNKYNVDTFYNSLTILMDRHKFQPQNIYNVDETGITTVQKPDRVVTRRGANQGDLLRSAERGTLVTVAFVANAIGNVIPPFFVFPRVRYQDHFVSNGPVGSAGASNPVGWLQDETFRHFLEHFKYYTNASLSQKVLLLLDNNFSQVHINALDFCKNNGIILLSYPPQCSQRLQPLDTFVFGPLKKGINSACHAWTQNHLDKSMSIYDIPGIVATAMPYGLTILNIQAGFRKTGIYPYNRNIFTERDFAPEFATDRTNPYNTTEAAVFPVRYTSSPEEHVVVTDMLTQKNTADAGNVVVSNINPSEDETAALLLSTLIHDTSSPEEPVVLTEMLNQKNTPEAANVDVPNNNPSEDETAALMLSTLNSDTSLPEEHVVVTDMLNQKNAEEAAIVLVSNINQSEDETAEILFSTVTKLLVTGTNLPKEPIVVTDMLSQKNTSEEAMVLVSNSNQSEDETGTLMLSALEYEPSVEMDVQHSSSVSRTEQETVTFEN